MIFCPAPWWISDDKRDSSRISNIKSATEQEEQVENEVFIRDLSDRNSQDAVALAVAAAADTCTDTVSTPRSFPLFTTSLFATPSYHDKMLFLGKRQNTAKEEEEEEAVATPGASGTPETVSTTNDSPAAAAAAAASSSSFSSSPQSPMTPPAAAVPATPMIRLKNHVATPATTMSSTPFIEEETEEPDSSEESEDQGNWIALPPPPQPSSEMKKTSRALNFDAFLGNGKSSSNGNTTDKTAATATSAASLSPNTVKCVGMFILVAFVATSVGVMYHFHSSVSLKEQTTRTVPFDLPPMFQGYLSTPSTLQSSSSSTTQTSTSNNDNKDTVAVKATKAPSSKAIPPPRSSVSKPAEDSNAAKKDASETISSFSTSSSSSLLTSAPTTFSTTTTSHSFELSSLLFWKTPSSPPKEQFFPEIDRVVAFVQRHVQQAVQETDAFLQQLAKTLQRLKQERVRQRHCYRQAMTALQQQHQQQEQK